MTSIVYAMASATLQAAIDIIKQYKVGFIMTQTKTSNYVKTEITEQLKVLTVIVQQFLRKKKEKAYPYQNFRDNECYRYEGLEYFMRDCIFKKVLSL